jgi:bacillithiol biosynthesis cysteine-adding enzyme BshC
MESVHAECLPFTNILATTRLFADFLYHHDKVARFYPRSPSFADWQEDEKRRIRCPRERCERVAAVLERQNREFGAGAKTLENIERLKRGTPAIITGQQVGLFGGPLFSLLKALTVSVLAEKADGVPVFWLATEDHDFAEINFVNLPAGDHLKTLATHPAHIEGAPVGTIEITHDITELFTQAKEMFGPSEFLELLKSSYRPGETFGTAFGKLYAQVFRDFGVVLLNPLDPELHRISQPIYREALDKWKPINHALHEREQQLEREGYHAQVKVTPSHTLCFHLQEGVRTPIRHDGDVFIAAERRFTRDELLAEVDRAPETFSANVLLRPIVQDYLLPTLCYAGGPAETAYFAQVAVVYEHLLGRITPVIPRFSATLVEARQAKLLERYDLHLTDAFRGPEKFREFVAGKALPQSITRSFDVAAEHVEQAFMAIQPPLEKLDKTLLDAAENAASKMRYQLQSLRDKAARAESRKNTETQRHADELSTLLYPNKNLQEREVGSAYFLLKYGTSLLSDLKDKFQPGCLDHQIISIAPGG